MTLAASSLGNVLSAFRHGIRAVDLAENAPIFRVTSQEAWRGAALAEPHKRARRRGRGIAEGGASHMVDAANLGREAESAEQAEPSEPAEQGEQGESVRSMCESASPVESLAAELETVRVALAQAQAQADAEADRALRATAEVENVRKRAERNIDSARKFALERFVEDLLPAVDSFEQATESASASDPGQALTEGVRLSLKLLIGAMEHQGVAVVDPIGAPFDPSAHEAITVVDSDQAEPGSVTQVLQKGYTLNGRLVRPARVVVSRHPPPNDGFGPAATGSDGGIDGNAPAAEDNADG